MHIAGKERHKVEGGKSGIVIRVTLLPLRIGSGISCARKRPFSASLSCFCIGMSTNTPAVATTTPLPICQERARFGEICFTSTASALSCLSFGFCVHSLLLPCFCVNFKWLSCFGFSTMSATDRLNEALIPLIAMSQAQIDVSFLQQ